MSLDPNSKLPLHRQLYERCRALILSGELRAHSQLPASRELAQLLGVSRNTVVNALDQLVAEGYLEGRLGSGMYVAALPAPLLSRPRRTMPLETMNTRPE